MIAATTPRVRRILVVDDDRAIREELAAALGNDPALEISLANDGKEALHLIGAGRVWPDVILLALPMMPDFDGDTFLAALDAINRTQQMAVIVMTALPKGEISDAVRKRASAILTKPFTLTAVAAAMRATR